MFKNKILFFLCVSFSLGFFFSDNDHFIQQYKTAKEDKDCAELKSLYQNDKFSLAPVSRVYSYRHCAENKDPHFHQQSFPPWLKRQALDAWFYRSSKNKNDKELMLAGREISRQSSFYEEKARYLIHAVRAAKKINAPEKKALIKELYKVSPSRSPKPKNNLQTALDLKKRALFHRSIQVFRKVLNAKTSSLEEKEASYRNLQWLYKKVKNKKKRIKAVRQYGVFLKKNRNKSSKARRAYFTNQIKLARSHWNQDSTGGALSVLNLTEKQYAGKPYLDQVYWLKGKIFEEKKQYRNAIRFFDKGRRLKNSKSEFYEKLVWSLVWNLRKLGQYDKALAVIDGMEAQGLSSKFIFWKAHILEEMGRPGEAVKYYRQLMDESPFNFHGLMAHYKTNRPLSLSLIQEVSTEDDPYQLMDDLIEADEKDLALKFMKHKIVEMNKRKEPPSGEELFQLFSHSAKAGFYLPLFQFIGKLSSEEKSSFMKKYAHLLFPKTYTKEVKKAEALFNTPSEIIYSIIRQESAFNTRALSPAYAVGLMQVLPSLARSVAKKEGIAFRKFYDLYHPETNILIGTAHLSRLMSRYGGYLILNAAIYNAGHRPVEKWVRRSSMDNPIEFIQNIPYNETRTYVRLIIRNLIFYKLLDHPEHKIEFPKWVLELPKSTKNALSANHS